MTKRPQLKIKPMPWTEERIDMLKGLWAEGYSCAQIASRLGGTSRCAVIGKVHRLNLAGRAVIHRGRNEPQRRLKHPRDKRFTVRDRFIIINAETGEQTDIRALENEPKPVALPDGSLIGVLEIGKGQCRWPHGDSKDLSTFHFCAHPTKPDSPYCLHHAARAFDKVRTRQSEDRAKEKEFERRCAA